MDRESEGIHIRKDLYQRFLNLPYLKSKNYNAPFTMQLFNRLLNNLLERELDVFEHNTKNPRIFEKSVSSDWFKNGNHNN